MTLTRLGISDGGDLVLPYLDCRCSTSLTLALFYYDRISQVIIMSLLTECWTLH